MVYLRAVQGIPLARLGDVLKDLFGLDISEGALVDNRAPPTNILAPTSTTAPKAPWLRIDVPVAAVG